MKPWGPASLLVFAAVLVATRAYAALPRPYDAPLLEGGKAEVPPHPPEYSVQDEAGIRFVYHPHARERVRPLFAKAVAIRAELAAELGRPVLDTIEIRVAPAPSEMAGLAPEVELQPYVTAVAFSELRLVVMSLGSPLSLEPPDLEEWLRHELAHVALDEALAPAEKSRAQIPRWFHEGFAVRFSGEARTSRAQALGLATFRERILPLRELEAQFPADAPQASIAYAESAELVRFLSDKSRANAFNALLRGVREGEAFGTALSSVYGDPVELETAFRKELAKRFGFLPVLLGATSIWVFVAAVVLLRRWHRRRAGLSTKRSRRARGENASGGAGRAARARPEREPEETMEPIPPEPEVPKVEHDGRWYTLH